MLSRLAITVAGGAGINLLQGQYGERTDIRATLAPWRYAAILLLAVGLVGFVAKGADYFRLKAGTGAAAGTVHGRVSTNPPQRYA